jgi:hypothetical protein
MVHDHDLRAGGTASTGGLTVCLLTVTTATLATSGSTFRWFQDTAAQMYCSIIFLLFALACERDSAWRNDFT